MLNQTELTSLYDVAHRRLQELSKTVLEGRRPPAGAYAFFNHNARALGRLENCQKCLTRLFEGRARLTELAIQEDEIKPEDWPPGVPFAEDVQRVMKEDSEVSGFMSHDLESLFVFGGMLLDQWSLQAMAVGNLQIKKDHPFRNLIRYLEDGHSSKLDPLWQRHKEDMLWLYYQVRFYRNRFVVHETRPWQRGTTRARFGEDFRLHTPSPPGWLDDKAIDKDIQDLVEIAPAALREMIKTWDAGTILRQCFYNIGRIEKREDRERVARLYGKKGGLTPTFQDLGEILYRLGADGTGVLNLVATKHINEIELGEPHLTSDEMRRNAEA